MTYILGALVAMFPFFSLPWTSGVLYQSQSQLLVSVFIIITTLYLLLQRKKEAINMFDFLPVLLLALVTIISYVLSIDTVYSVSGGGVSLYSMNTACMLFSLWVLSRELTDTVSIQNGLVGFVGISTCSQIYMSFGYIFDFNWFVNPFGTLVSFSVYAGVSILIGLYLLHQKKHVPIALFGLVVSAVTLLVTDWYLLPGISFSLITLIYCFVGVYLTKGSDFVKRKGVVISFVVLFILQLCSPWIADVFASHSQRFEADKSYVQVELGASISVAEKVFGSSFVRMLFGTGPDTYTFAWHQFKPVELPGSVNITKYWDYDFAEAGSLILTQITTLGLFGLLFWLYVSFLVVVTLQKSLITRDMQSVYLSLANLLVLVVLWLSSVNIGIYLLFFILFGLMYKNIHIVPRMMVRKEYILAVLLVTQVYMCWYMVRVYKSVRIVDSALVDLYAYAHQGVQELQKTEEKVSKALSYNDTLEYRRLLSNLIVSQVDQGQFATTTSIQLLAKAEGYLSSGIQESIHFRDWMQMGRVYEYQTMFGATSSAPRAYQAYTIASVLAPTHPEPFYALSLIHLYAGNYTEANESVKKTLLLKPNYTEALLLYKQLNATNTNILGNMGV
jgi:tetratricopeptide (TPR) repeat protein